MLWRRVAGGVIAIAIVWAVEWAASSVLNPYIYRVLVLCSINVILALSLNLVNGITGQFSIGHAGFMAVGAYASAAYTVAGRSTPAARYARLIASTAPWVESGPGRSSPAPAARPASTRWALPSA